MVKERTVKGRKPSNLKQLHDIIGRIWILWKDIAIGSHLVVDRCQPGSHKRKNIRLFVGIAENKSIGKGKGMSKLGNGKDDDREDGNGERTRDKWREGTAGSIW
jgi:hypothetical protein